MQERAGTASLRRYLLDTAVVAAVLGVLPFVWGASLVWRLLGPLVAVVLLGRAAVRVWRSAFSTRARHPTPPG